MEIKRSVLLEQLEGMQQQQQQQVPPGTSCHFRYTDGRHYAGIVAAPPPASDPSGEFSVQFAVPTR